MSSQSLNDTAISWSPLNFIQGDPVLPTTSLHQHIVVLELWATWCPPCRTSVPHLNSLHQRYHKAGVRVVGITNETDKAKLLKFIAGVKGGMTYPVAIDDEGVMQEWQDKYRVQGIPHAWILDWQGKVRWSGHPMAGLDDKLEVLVNEFKQWKAKQGAGQGAAQGVGQGAGDGDGAAAEEAGKKLKGMTEEELQGKGTGELMRLMKEARIDTAGCIEKSDLISRIKGKTL